MKEKGIKPPTPERLRYLKSLGYTQKDIATIYEVRERTVRNWKKGENKNKQKVGRKPKISGRLLIDFYFFLQGLKRKRNLTQQQMANYLSKKADKEISRLAVLRTLKKLGFTRKKLTNHYLEQLGHSRKVKKFKELIAGLPQNRIITLDECGFHLNETPRYGYSHKSSRARYTKPGYPGNNHTLMLCIQNVACKGVIHYELIEGGMKTENFHNFLTNLQLPTNEKHYLIMDNLPVHKAKQSCIKLGLAPIKDLLESKNIEVIFLPPYTPEMNPVEYCFNFIRHEVEKNKPRTYEKLKEVIAKIINILNQEDLTKWFRHCQNYNYSNEEAINSANMPFWRRFIRESGVYKRGAEVDPSYLTF